MQQRNFINTVVLVLLFMSSANAQPTPAIDRVFQFEEYRQFDFWIGTWEVNLRRIQEDHTWVDWKKAIAHIHPILDGKAILELWEDQYDGSPQEVIIGYSLRYYNSATGKWHLWLNWPGSNRSGSSSLEGQFQHCRGEFFSERPIDDSTNLISRYTFSDITDHSLRWDDAFSRDGGKTWSHNWIMEFTRNQEQAPWDKDEDQALHSFRSGNRCTLTGFDLLDQFVGLWKGTIEYLGEQGQWHTTQATLNNYKALGGCSVMSFLHYPRQGSIFREFSLMTYNTYANLYEDGRLDNTPTSHYRPMFGELENDTLTLVRQNHAPKTIAEKYIWTFPESGELQVEKWALVDGALKKVAVARFKKEQ